MRLTENEKAIIIQSIDKFRAGQPMAIYLHGSRVDDSLRGGDIDLLLLVHDDQTEARLRGTQIALLVDMKSGLGERRVDLTISTRARSTRDPFLATVLPKALLLAHWT